MTELIFNSSQVFTKTHISKLFDQYKTGSQQEQMMILLVFKAISEKRPSHLADFFPQLCDDSLFKPDSLTFRSSVVACVGGVNKVYFKWNIL